MGEEVPGMDLATAAQKHLLFLHKRSTFRVYYKYLVWDAAIAWCVLDNIFIITQVREPLACCAVKISL